MAAPWHVTAVLGGMCAPTERCQDVAVQPYIISMDMTSMAPIFYTIAMMMNMGMAAIMVVITITTTIKRRVVLDWMPWLVCGIQLND